MALRFSKENMWTAAGFVLDSFDTEAATFTEVSADEFGGAFRTNAGKTRDKIKTAVGGALRAGAGTQVTTRLYQNMDAVRPLLDRLDIRLGLLDAKALASPVKDFGLKKLRAAIEARDAEASSRALTVLEAAITSSHDALMKKGYTTAEEEKLRELHQAIDDDNALQNKNLNTNTGATAIEDKDYKELDKLLGRIMRTGRLLFKSDKQKRRQFEVAWIQKRIDAGEKPKLDGGV
jgi:hypothetical protein